MPIVADVMTTELVTASTDTPFKDIVDLLVRHEISAVPVVDSHNRLVGVVSEADLLCKEEHADDVEQVGPAVLAGRRTRAEWRKAGGLTAREVMTRPLLSVSSAAFLPNAARVLARANVRRMFVVDNGKLVGVVSRRDLLRAFLRSDSEIRTDVQREVLVRALSADPDTVRATVEHGVVTLTGQLNDPGDVRVAELLARALPGVVAVHNQLTAPPGNSADGMPVRDDGRRTGRMV